jgi:hypothetical protein
MRSSTRPKSRPSGVNRLSALSALNRRRCSDRLPPIHPTYQFMSRRGGLTLAEQVESILESDQCR